MSYSIKIAGVAHAIRETNGAAFRLGGLPYGLPRFVAGESSDHVLFRWYVIKAWSMLADEASRSKYPTPESVAEAIADDERAPLMATVAEALQASSAPPDPGKKTRRK